MRGLLIVLGLCVAAWWYLGGGMQTVGSHVASAVATGVAQANSRYYESSARNGDSSAACADANLARGAWSLAGNSAKASQYEARGDSDCHAASAPRSAGDPFKPVVTTGSGFRAP